MVRPLLLTLLCVAVWGFVLMAGCGEIEQLKTQERYSAAEFEQVISPLLAPMGCESCHREVQGGFKWDPSGTPEAMSENLLYTQRFMNADEPTQSPLLVRLTPPRSSHPLYFCPNDCTYQAILAWGSSLGPTDFMSVVCEAPPELHPISPEACL